MSAVANPIEQARALVRQRASPDPIAQARALVRSRSFTPEQQATAAEIQQLPGAYVGEPPNDGGFGPEVSPNRIIEGLNAPLARRGTLGQRYVRDPQSPSGVSLLDEMSGQLTPFDDLEGERARNAEAQAAAERDRYLREVGGEAPSLVEHAAQSALSFLPGANVPAYVPDPNASELSKLAYTGAGIAGTVAAPMGVGAAAKAIGAVPSSVMLLAQGWGRDKEGSRKRYLDGLLAKGVPPAEARNRADTASNVMGAFGALLNLPFGAGVKGLGGNTALGAGFGGAQNAAEQGIGEAVGAQDEIDPIELLQSTLFGGATSGVLHALPGAIDALGRPTREAAPGPSVRRVPQDQAQLANPAEQPVERVPEAVTVHQVAPSETAPASETPIPGLPKKSDSQVVPSGLGRIEERPVALPQSPETSTHADQPLPDTQSVQASDYSSWTTAQLKAEARRLGLDPVGGRRTLVERLTAAQPPTTPKTPSESESPQAIATASSSPAAEPTPVHRLSEAGSLQEAPASDLSSLPVKDLKAMAVARGLSVVGGKRTLVERLAASARDSAESTGRPVGADHTGTRQTTDPDQLDLGESARTELALRTRGSTDLVRGSSDPAQPPAAVSQSPKTSPTVAADAAGSPAPRSMEQRLLAFAEEAKARRLERRIPRGKAGAPSGASTIIPDLVDIAAEYSARAAAQGIKGTKALREFVAAQIDEHTPELRKHSGRVRAAVARILDGSTSRTGEYDADLFEAAVHDEQQRNAPKEPSAKSTIRKTTGVADTSPQVEKTEAQALKGQLRREVVVARDADRAARKEMTGTFVDAIAANKKQWQERLATKTAGMYQIRREVVRMAEEHLHPADRGKLLPLVARAKTIGDLAEAASRIGDLYGLSVDREAREALRKTVGKAPRDKTEIRELPELGTMKATTPREPTYVSEAKKIDPAKLRPVQRDKLMLVVRSVQERSAIKGTKDLADYLQEEIDRGRSNLFEKEDLATLRGLEGRGDRDIDEAGTTLLDRAIRHTAHLSDIENQAHVLGEYRKVNEDAVTARHELVARVKEPKQGMIDKALARPERAPNPNALKRLVTHERNDLLRLVANTFGRDSVVYKYTYENVADADSRAYQLLWNGLRHIDKVREKHKVKDNDIGRMGKRLALYDLPDAGRVRLTEAEAVHAYALWTDPENRPNLLREGVLSKRFAGVSNRVLKLSASDFEAIGSKLTKFQRDYIDAFKQYTNGPLREAINSMSVKLWGFEIANNPEYVSRKLDYLLRTGLSVDESIMTLAWGENAGIFQDRTISSAPIVLDNFFGAAREHIAAAGRFAATADPIRSVRLLMSDPDLQATIADRLGPKWMNEVLERLSEVGGRRGGKTGAVDTVAKWLQKGRSVAALTYKIPTAAANWLGGVSASWMEMSPREIAQSVKNTAPVRVGQALKVLERERGYFMDRWARGGEDVAAGINIPRSVPETRVGAAYRDLIELGFKPMEVTDQWVAATAYWSAHDAAKAEHQDWTVPELESFAARRAEFIMRGTQNPTTALDRSGIANDARISGMKGLWAQFSGGPNKIGNVIEERTRQALRTRSGKDIAALAVALFAAGIGSVIYEGSREFNRRLKVGFSAEERPRTTGDLLVNATSDLGDYVLPQAGSVIKKLVNSARGRHVFSDQDAFSEAATAIGAVAKDLGDGEMDRRTWARVERVARATAPVIGLPVAVVDQLRGLWRIAEAPANVATLEAALDRGDDAEVERIAKAMMEAEPNADLRQRLQNRLRKRQED